MGKRVYLTLVLASALGAYAAGCGDDDDDVSSAGTGGGGGTGSPTGGTGGTGGGGTKPDPDEPNPDCPSPQNDIGPDTGPYQQKGACCYRTSNTKRIDESAAERVYEYRLNYFVLINHQDTISPVTLGPIQIGRSDNEEQSLLFRFTMPQMDGKLASGDGNVKLGAGRYNCDGTYSFYSKTAAMNAGANNKPDRWWAPELPAKVDATKTDRDRVKVVYKDSLEGKNTESYTPYLGGAPNYDIDWEGESQGFDILQMPSADSNIDCVGERQDMLSWKPAGKTVAYARLDLNGVDVLDSLGVNFCQLMAFGAIADAPDCQVRPRCTPGEAGCMWRRLPDSLCPATDDEKSKWSCHLGADNKDNEGVTKNCTNEAPTGQLDPSNGTSEGQCCDPTASGMGGLPACNAWVQINEFVAAAAEITDELSNEVQKSCHGI